MKNSVKFLVFFMVVSVVLCYADTKITVRFPDAETIFITTGDGHFKDYTPMGQIFYFDSGFRLNIPFLGLIPFKTVDPELALQTKVAEMARAMGADAVINVLITYRRQSGFWLGLLGFGASGGKIVVYGTAIRRK